MALSIKTYTYPNDYLGITVTYTEVSDGSTDTRIEYNLTPEERNALPHPQNVDTWKAAKAVELGLTLQEYDDAVTAEAALAPYAAKGERMEKAYQRLKGEFRAYNGGRVARGECNTAEMRAFLGSAEGQSVFASLRALDFSGAVEKINAMTEPLATQGFKDYWTRKITAEL